MRKIGFPGVQGARPARLAVAALVAVAIAGSFLHAYPTQLDFRQRVAVLQTFPARWMKRPVVLMIGDSRVAALRCEKQFSGRTILNLGISGLTARELRSGLGRWTDGLEDLDRTILWIGVNDLLRRRDAAGVAADILAILQHVAGRSKRVALIAPIPVIWTEGQGRTYGLTREDAMSIDRGLEAVQSNVKAALAADIRYRHVDELVLFPMNRSPEHLQVASDAFHLSEDGNARLCALLHDWSRRK